MKNNLFDLTLEEFCQNFLNYIKDMDIPCNMDYLRRIQSISLNIYKPDIILIRDNHLYEVAYGNELVIMLLYLKKSLYIIIKYNSSANRM
jgi:hypothetical protein